MLRSGFVLACLLLSACTVDPVREQTIDELGPEKPGVHPGPLHRPNQPCVVCHGGSGPGNAVFSLAGTIYQEQQGLAALPNALVHFVDSSKTPRHYQVATNCAGNFFVDENDFAPVFPVWMSIEFGSVCTAHDPNNPSVCTQTQPWIVPMSTPSFRERSCAACHRDPASANSVGHVYLFPTLPGPLPPSGCP